MPEYYQPIRRRRRPRSVVPLKTFAELREERAAKEAAEQAAQPDIGDLQRYLAMGARGVGALAGITPVTGAVGGGLGETAAQMIERGTIDPRELNLRRIGGEAAVGAAYGKYAKLLGSLIGRTGRAIGAGAVAGAAAPVLRHGIEEGEWDPFAYPGEFLTSAAVSGATGGALAKLLGAFRKPAAAPAMAPYQVETTAVPGGRTLAGGLIRVGKGGKTALTRAKLQDVQPIRPVPSTGVPIGVRPPSTGLVTEPVPYVGMPSVTKAQERMIAEAEQFDRIRKARHVARAMPQAPSFGTTISAKTPEGLTERARVQYTLPDEETANEATRILLGQAETPIAAPVPTPPPTPAVVPAVEESVTPLERILRPTRARKTKAESFQERVSKILTQVEGRPPTLEAPIPMPLPEAVPVPEAPAALPGLVQQLRTLQPAEQGLDLLGKQGRYGRLQKLFLEGLKPGEPRKHPEGSDVAIAAALLRRTAGELGLPTGSAARVKGPTLTPTPRPIAAPEALKTPPPSEFEATQAESMRSGAEAARLADIEQTGRAERLERDIAELRTPATAPSMSMEDLAENARILAELEQLPKKARASRKPLLTPRLIKKPGERGAVSPELLARLGLGAGGALVGAAWDPLDDPTLSALAGAGVGAALPSAIPALQRLGTRGAELPSATATAQRAMPTEEMTASLSEKAQAIGKYIARFIPQAQRANYLYDLWGLPANVIAGPYGSGFFGSLERALAGDPRGRAALRELTDPQNLRELQAAWEEAGILVGRAERAEGAIPFATAVGIERVQQAPGALMTTGDVFIRRLLQRAGFSEAEARAMTLTSEPFTKSGAAGAHLRGPLWEFLFPFKRTPINILEQGALRTPGLGFLMQAIGAGRGTRPADTLRQQLIQQGMGAGVLGGSGALGSYIPPEQARNVRRYVTNLAGPYSLLAGVGFAGGQGYQRGQSIGEAVARTLPYQLPLPSVDPIAEWGQYLAGRREALPRGAYPSFIRQLREGYEEKQVERALRGTPRRTRPRRPRRRQQPQRPQ